MIRSQERVIQIVVWYSFSSLREWASWLDINSKKCCWHIQTFRPGKLLWSALQQAWRGTHAFTLRGWADAWMHYTSCAPLCNGWIDLCSGITSFSPQNVVEGLWALVAAPHALKPGIYQLLSLHCRLNLTCAVFHVVPIPLLFLAAWCREYASRASARVWVFGNFARTKPLDWI